MSSHDLKNTDQTPKTSGGSDSLSQELASRKGQSYRRTSMSPLFLGGLIGFCVGVMGNLVAAWIQQEIMENMFTSSRIMLIIMLTIIGLIVAALIDQSRSQVDTNNDDSGDMVTRRVWLSHIRLWASKLNIRGRGSHIDNVTSIGSEIDIDTRD